MKITSWTANLEVRVKLDEADLTLDELRAQGAAISMVVAMIASGEVPDTKPSMWEFDEAYHRSYDEIRVCYSVR